MNTQEKAYISGFIKRASEYGLNSAEAIELLKQANILGEAAYTGIKKDINSADLEEGEGARAHLKRNANKYVAAPVYGAAGAGIGALSGSISAGDLINKHHGGVIPSDTSKLRKLVGKHALIGGGTGALIGLLLGAKNDREMKQKIQEDALKAELIKAKGGDAKGYVADPYAGSGTLAFGGGVAAGLASLLGLEAYRNIKSKIPPSAAEQYGRAAVAKRVGPKLLR